MKVENLTITKVLDTAKVASSAKGVVATSDSKGQIDK